MQPQLPPRRAAALGLTLLAALGLAGFGLVRIGGRQGLFADSFDVSVGFPEVHDLRPGTAVRLRGVDAGQVVAIDYPAVDGPDAAVTVQMRLDSRFRDRLYADASAQVHATSLLGAKVIAVDPGSPSAGPFTGEPLRATVAPDLAQAAAKLGAAADEARLMIHDARTGPGTVGRLIRDDDLYADFKGLVGDSRKQVQKLDGFVTDGRETLKSIKKSSDALSGLPLIRRYVPEDARGLVTRPDWTREAHSYRAADLFDADSAILTEAGQQHAIAEATWLKALTNADAELVVAVTAGSGTEAQASVLTQARADAVVKFLKDAKAHRLSWLSSRKFTAVGLGRERLPGAEPGAPGDAVVFLLFTPP